MLPPETFLRLASDSSPFSGFVDLVCGFGCCCCFGLFMALPSDTRTGGGYIGQSQERGARFAAVVAVRFAADERQSLQGQSAGSAVRLHPRFNRSRPTG